MKTKTILITLITMLAVAALVFQSCKKDEPKEDPTPPIYTNGQGEIGEIGGTVKIEDSSSPINGASIVLPEGALKSNVVIKITEGENVYVPGHDSIKLVQFLPVGLEFLKEVEITLPWSQSSQTTANTRAYYLDEENSTLKQIEIKSVDVQNKLTKAYTTHFSGFFTDPDELNYEMEMVKVGNNFAGYFNLQTVFDQIPAIINDGRNAEDIINQEDGLENCTVRLIFELFEKDGWFWEEVADMSIYIDNDEWSGGYSIWIEKSNSSMGGNSSFQILNKDGLSFNQMTETWMSGYPFIAIFDEDTYLSPDFIIDEDNNYRMSCKWGIVKDYNGFLKPYVWTWQYGYETDKKKWSQVSSFTGDADQNNIIDSYETGVGNNPPNDPTNPSPSNNASNISINTNISWTCSDPEEDELDYNIYFGTSSNPSLAEEYYTSTSWNPGTLDENTTYYWKIKAYEVGNEDNQSTSPVWQFTTTDDGGSNTPPTAFFTVSPPSGTTSTNFEFDASGSTDNEDPTNNLQVRWDFDGNGSWDTGWDYDKTENHQYSNENTYAAKLEVKDTEGLTDIYTKNITVSNGSGNGIPCPGIETVSYGGQVYNTVLIGNQCWFKENLNYESGNSWCYENDPGNCDTYGRLYDWETALGVCPSGWHLPSDEEWNILEGTVDSQYPVGDPEWDDTGWRGLDAGLNLKSTSGWYSNGNGTDLFGFSALPGGVRNDYSNFYFQGYGGYWWSSDELSSNDAWTRELGYDSALSDRNFASKDYGFGVRCLRD